MEKITNVEFKMREFKPGWWQAYTTSILMVGRDKEKLEKDFREYLIDLYTRLATK